jgi:hypothetical protein
MDIEEFYEADERRRRSEEIELGTDWHDAQGVRYELSWVADTGELYVMREPAGRSFEDPFGDVFASPVPVDALTVAVLGWIPDRDRMEHVLDGWQDAMTRRDSVAWLAGRLSQESVPRNPSDS